MTPKDVLVDYLHDAHDAMVWKVEGLSDYDAARPLTPTGTNLLGLIKHLASCELGYFGDTFDRPHGIDLPWQAPGVDPNEDLYLSQGQSRAWVLDLYQRAWSHTEETCAALDLDSPGRVPWWPAERAEVTLQQILVHMLAETSRHAGHADILREQLDSRAGRRAGDRNMDATYDWPAHVARVEEAARSVAAES